MNYIFSPLYKYIAFILIFFLFVGNYKLITQPNYLLIAIVATILMVSLDFFLIEDHPNLLQDITSDNDSKDTDDILENLVSDSDKSTKSNKSNDNLDDLDDTELLTEKN